VRGNHIAADINGCREAAQPLTEDAR
jgi:hypothetical protein